MLNDVGWAVLVLILLMAALPLVIFQCAKFGRMGYLMAERRFRERYSKKKEDESGGIET